MKFGEPILMGTGLEEKARRELLSKMVELRKSPRKTREDKCKDSSTPKQKTDDKIIEHVRGDKIGTSNIIKSTNILKARAGGEARVERVGRGQGSRISDDNDNASEQRREVSQEEERRGGIGQSFSGCGLGEELENLRETAPWFWHDGRQQPTRVATSRGNCST